VTYVWPVYGKTCALAQWIYLYILVSTSPSCIIPGVWWSSVYTRWQAGPSNPSSFRPTDSKTGKESGFCSFH